MEQEEQREKEYLIESCRSFITALLWSAIKDATTSTSKEIQTEAKTWLQEEALEWINLVGGNTESWQKWIDAGCPLARERIVGRALREGELTKPCLTRGKKAPDYSNISAIEGIKMVNEEDDINRAFRDMGLSVSLAQAAANGRIGKNEPTERPVKRYLAYGMNDEPIAVLEAGSSTDAILFGFRSDLEGGFTGKVIEMGKEDNGLVESFRKLGLSMDAARQAAGGRLPVYQVPVQEASGMFKNSKPGKTQMSERKSDQQSAIDLIEKYRKARRNGENNGS